ncbi:MAG TPA: hypothetical protein VIJ69_08110 [Actinomycetota bacterium]
MRTSDERRTMLRRLGAIGAALAVLLLGLAPASQASVSIVVLGSGNLGSVSTGTSTLTAQLGLVTAAGGGILGVQVTANVTCSDFKTGSGTAAETISKTKVFYWSGPTTAYSGLVGSGTPGQPTSADQVSCATSHQAFQGQALLLSVSVTWNPTIVIQIPASAVAGTYTGTVTHTVV